MIDQRDKAYYKGQWKKYEQLKSEVQAHISSLKQSYCADAVKSNNPKRVWKCLRNLSRNNMKTTESNLGFSANEFCEHFASNFQAHQKSEYQLDSSCVFEPISCYNVHLQLSKLNKSSIGPDGIPQWIYLVFADFLAPAITLLFNWSLCEGVVPTCFKTANVIPIPKVNDPKELSDFRPISILPAISKAFERIISSNYIHPIVNNTINKSQFGFVPRPGSGTSCALVLAQHQILKFLDTPGAVRILSVDMSKAFDKIPHSVILLSCCSFHLPNFLIKWIDSFLADRVQRVFCNNSFSTWCSVSSGVPQGSVLGPLLFVLAVDNFSCVQANTSVIKYADDFLFLHFIRRCNEDKLQSEWNNLIEWSNSVNLPLNFSKCLVMDVITKTGLSTTPICVSNDFSLRQVNSFVYLGVTLSCDMKWNKHVENAVRKASRRIFIIRNLRRAGCDQQLIWNCYLSFIRSVLLYAYPSFCNVPEYLMKDFFMVERRVRRIIGPVDAEFESLQSAANKTCMKLFRSIVCNVHHPLRELFTERHTRTTRSSAVFYAPFSKTSRFGNSFIKFGK